MSVNHQKVEDVFLEAIRSEDIVKVQACINLGVDVNFHDEAGLPALLHASFVNSTTILDILLAQPYVDVNIKGQKDGIYATALMFSCAMGRINAVKRLCQVPGIDLNLRDDDGATAAFYATSFSRVDCVKFLSTLPDVDWNIRASFGRFPIVHVGYVGAVTTGSVDVFRILLAIPSIDLNATDAAGRDITQKAVQKDSRRSLQCLELLANDSRVNWNVRNVSGDTPIMYAVKNKKNEIFKILVKVPTIDFTVLQDVKMDNEFLIEYFKQVPQMTSSIQPPECPVCYEKFTRGGHVFQCVAGHFICDSCFHQIKRRQQTCPNCRGQMTGRAHDFEQFLSTLNI